MDALTLLVVAQVTVARLHPREPEDLAQDVVLRLLEAPPPGEGYTSAQTAAWYYRRARWEALKLLRRPVPRWLPLDLVDVEPPAGDDPFGAVVVRRAVARDERAFIELLGPVPPGLNQNAAHQRAFRLRVKINAALTTEGVG